MKKELESNEQIQQPQQKTGIRTLNSEDRHAVWVADGDERFVVPRRYAANICAAVAGLRFSFEHIGGRHVGHASQFFETVRHAEHKEHTAEAEESVVKEDEDNNA